MTGPAIAGVLEGFYGPPWSWEARVEVARWCTAHGMTDYVYAPKDDPKHRASWREPYDDEELAGFARVASDGGVRVGFAISPGLSMRYDLAADRAALAAKVDQVVAAGARHVMLALDDIPFGGGPQGEVHAQLTAWLRDHLDGDVVLTMIPTEYVGVRPSPYLDALAAGVPAEVPIGWTGVTVVAEEITAAHAEARAAALGGRLPLLWDNYPVNDGLMADLLPIGPLRGRSPDLPVRCSGHLSNAALQARASTLPLASIAAWLRGEDPAAAWAAEADRLGWRTFAEACDGWLPRALVDGDLPAARAWFDAASACEAPGLEDEAGAWLEQVRREARLALAALRLLDEAAKPEPDHDVVLMEATGIAGRWHSARRRDVQVMGERWAFRPVFGQAPDGRWSFDRASVTEDRNAVDRLVRRALDAAASTA
jgi:hypothetical protein